MAERAKANGIGATLGAVREDLGVSLREQARRMEISHPRVAAFERGTADPRLGTIAGYAAALGAELALTLTLPDGRVVDLLEVAKGEHDARS